jgi:hypothetical protein
MSNIFDKLGLDGRNAATVRAIECLAGPKPASVATKRH